MPEVPCFIIILLWRSKPVGEVGTWVQCLVRTSCWERTAPTPMPEASTLTINWPSESGMHSTGAIVNFCWIMSNTLCALAVQENPFVDFLVRSLIGAARVLNFWIKWQKKLANPINRRTEQIDMERSHHKPHWIHNESPLKRDRGHVESQLLQLGIQLVL